MNLRTKKELAAKTFEVGKERIVFVKERLDEIKEAITKQDMRDLKNEGAIKIKEISGRRKKMRKSKKRSPGNVRKRVNKRKREYVLLTRKLRKHLKELKKRGIIKKKDAKEIRKKIRNKDFRSKAHLKESLGSKK